MRDLHTIYDLLLAHFGLLTGPAARQPWWPIFSEQPLLEIVVGAVLVQQTRWETVEGAIVRLRDAGLLSVAALAEADPGAVATIIRPAAFHSQKAPGLIAIARHVQQGYGGDLAAMLAQPTGPLRRELLGLPRIGPETADVILLYGAGHPVFVVDEYTRRLFERVAVVAGGATHQWRASYEALRQAIEQQLAAELASTEPDQHGACHQPRAAMFAEYHAQINEACVRYCLSQPRCDGPPARRVYSRQNGRESYLARDEGCPLRAVCGYYQRKNLPFEDFDEQKPTRY